MDATGNIFDRNPKLRFLKRFVEINNILMAIMGFILFSVMCTIVVIRFFLSLPLICLLFFIIYLFSLLFIFCLLIQTSDKYRKK